MRDRNGRQEEGEWRRGSSGYGDREGGQWDGIGEKGEMGDKEKGQWDGRMRWESMEGVQLNGVGWMEGGDGRGIGRWDGIGEKGEMGDKEKGDGGGRLDRRRRWERMEGVNGMEWDGWKEEMEGG